MKVSMISLGCPKNQVDGEIMLKLLSDAGIEYTADEYEADAVIVNTCGFINSAKKEAIDAILDAAELKEKGKLKALVVTGCLAERYMDDIRRELPEVDAVVGIGSNRNIAEIVKEAVGGEKKNYPAPKSSLLMDSHRILANESHYAYLRIADGCSNCCTYCAIPKIRGEYRSRNFESIVEEAENLAEAGVKEIILIAQDITRYGVDLYKRPRLAELLREIAKIDKIKWIRLLYTYPDLITDELIDTIASEEKVLNYIDIPLQHASGKILKKMNRRGDAESLSALINKIRTKIPGVTIRTTFITGFPSESEEDFDILCDFVEKMRFDRMGAFAYSAEEGTAAAEMADQIDEKTKTERQNIIMEIQYRIMEEQNALKIGKTEQVLVEGYDGENELYFGRSRADAPDIDCRVYFTSKDKCRAGDLVNVEISEVMEYDLLGKRVKENANEYSE